MDFVEGTEAQDGVYNSDDVKYKTRDWVEDDLNPCLI